MSWWSVYISAFLIALSMGCASGASYEEPIIPGTAVAVAGDDRNAVVGEIIRLDASQSYDTNGAPLTYRWSLRAPADSRSRLSSATFVRTEFQIDRPGPYQVSLVVHNGREESETDVVTITAFDDATRPLALISAPAHVETGREVILDGSQSVDPEGRPLTYEWSVSSEPDGSQVELRGQRTARASMVPTEVGRYGIRLTVRNDEVSSPVAETFIDVIAPSGLVARAGGDQTVVVGSTVQLDGSQSTGPPGFEYLWSLIERPLASSASLSATGSAQPTFRADVAGRYVARLVVRYEGAASAPSDVRIQSQPTNRAPVAVIQSVGERRLGQEIELDGSDSFDPDEDPISFQWTVSSRPTGSAATLQFPISPEPRLVPDVVGTYVVQLVVSDGELQSAPAAVTITVRHRWPVVEGQVIITEIMYNPRTLPDAQGEYVELYNPTNTTWDLKGCELSDLRADLHVIASGLEINPGEYIVLARSSDPGFTPDYVYSGFVLRNNDDEVILSCGPAEIAQVAYDVADGWPNLDGSSLTLMRSRYDEVLNDDPSSWCASVTLYNGDYGTPGAENEFIDSCEL